MGYNMFRVGCGLAVAAVWVLLCQGGYALAANSPQADSQSKQAVDQLAKCWTAFYGEKYEDAIRQAAPLPGLSAPKLRWVAVQAGYVQARSYWAHGRASQGKAQQMWRQLGKLFTRNSLKARLKIASALQQAASGDTAKAAETLRDAPEEPVGGRWVCSSDCDRS